jgi:hypothetical protein
MGGKRPLVLFVEGMPSIEGLEQFVNGSSRNILRRKFDSGKTVAEPAHLSIEVKPNAAKCRVDCSGLIRGKNVAMTIEPCRFHHSNLVCGRTIWQPIQRAVNKNIVAAHWGNFAWIANVCNGWKAVLRSPFN